MSEKIFPPFKFLAEIREYATAPTGLHDEIAERLQRRDIDKFWKAHPERRTEFNTKILANWLELYGVPLLLWNLEIAFQDLSADGLLESATPAEPIPVSDRGVTHELPGLAYYRPSREEAAQLKKVSDDVGLSDVQR